MPELFDLLSTRTIKVAEHFGIFEKFIGGAHSFKHGLVEEKIIVAVNLPLSGLTCCVRDREAQVWMQIHNLANKCGLPGAGWR